MTLKKSIYLLLFCIALNFNCSSEKGDLKEENPNQNVDPDIPEENEGGENTTPQKDFKLLSLGDSYTIGESVCEACRFPEQLKTNLLINTDNDIKSIELKVIATTGWTTTNLIRAVDNENLSNDYDLVTLLIGVNNQYQNKSFSIYEEEFPKLAKKAITYAKARKFNVIVISIPDYAFTPFGQSIATIGNISSEIDKYNNFAKDYCDTNNITFINITDITRNGIMNPELVASDGLHPSKIAYSKFIERILPIAIEKLKK